MCPICSGEFSEPPAASRRDSDLMICSKCATKEALDDVRFMIGKGMDDQQWEDFKEQILNIINVAKKDSVG